jgi:glyoxylase-like metal-dependent hydrolase (beta-lactamase superfamily II)/rhodanese-related sulfurtransferase
MILQRYYLKCLSLGSYLLADEAGGEAAVIDPQRDIRQYEDLLREKGLKLKYILETHLHADFVSGHVELAQKTGARIVYGREAKARMPHLAVKDGDRLRLGEGVEIEVLETPGHTPESVCYLVRDLRRPDAPMKLFTGDTLFVGDVGRPDLLGGTVSAEELASKMYESLHRKILPLPDETEIYPAHGAGSACGRNLGDAEFTTLAEQKRDNYALKEPSRERFIELLTEDQPDAPAYFGMDARINREGAPSLETVLADMRPMGPDEVEARLREGAVLVDTRSPDDFAAGSPPEALQIGLDGQFAGWVGTLVPKGRPLIFIADPGREEEAATRCARVGYDTAAGWLEGGVDAWERSGRPLARYRRAGAEELADSAGRSDVLVLDVRRPPERAALSLEGARHIPLNRLPEAVAELPRHRDILVHCASGYRSAIAVSLLRRLGFARARDVAGGLNGYVALGLPLDPARAAERRAGA